MLNSPRIDYDWDLILKAQEIATRQHESQYRKGTSIPYILHPNEVANAIYRMHGSTAQVCAAYLHDTIEDTSYTLDELLVDFNQEIYDLVNFCTENMEEKGPIHSKSSWKSRKQEVIEKVQGANNQQLVLIFADKYCNLESFCREQKDEGIEFWSRFNGTRDEQHWFYSTLFLTFEKELGCDPRYEPLVNEYRSKLECLWPDMFVN
ncbi:hypothetical protein CL619_03390 [archaeon]|nr:hypothetical protein [archaeon]|tara:strand:+ start:3404 stop:4021 length:618 start_codon:yes stop_codon:yes gene_type:complete